MVQYNLSLVLNKVAKYKIRFEFEMTLSSTFAEFLLS